MVRNFKHLLLCGILLFSWSAHTHQIEESEDSRVFVKIPAKDRYERTKIADAGVSIEGIRSDSIWGIADPTSLKKLKEAGLSYELQPFAQLNFPPQDSRYHTYSQAEDFLRRLASAHSDITRLRSLGKSVQGREIWAIHFNSSDSALESGLSNKPGVAIMGAHHAREHLSTEVPLLLAEYLLENRDDPRIKRLLETRDIWIVPMVNPDGVEWDISGTQYKWWRKNRTRNHDGSYGVDLNRNYGYLWGGPGASDNPRSDTYRGKSPFSEPESRAVRDFVLARSNLSVLLSIHTFSELILYPWGHTYDSIANQADREAFEIMAQTMSRWNGYTPQQSSDLYVTTGDTTDWAYGELGIFAFTFELSPKTMWDGGFYPGPDMIDIAFQANLRPSLYLMDVADNPHKVRNRGNNGRWLDHYVEPQISHEMFW
jgi:carboxypeptidase T